MFGDGLVSWVEVVAALTMWMSLTNVESADIQVFVDLCEMLLVLWNLWHRVELFIFYFYLLIIHLKLELGYQQMLNLLNDLFDFGIKFKLSFA